MAGRPKAGEEHPREDWSGKIELMVAVGLRHEDIAAILNCSKRTLHQHYEEALTLGTAKASLAVGGRIYQAAMRNEEWALKFWAARRMGWAERVTQEHVGKDGGPIEIQAEAGSAREKLAAMLATAQKTDAKPQP